MPTGTPGKTGPLPPSKQALLKEECIRRGWEVEYTDLAPEIHAGDAQSLCALLADGGDFTVHPLFRAKLCPRGATCDRERCAGAHSTHELRLAEEVGVPRYKFSLTLVLDHGQRLEFRNHDDHATRNDAKANVAAQCIRVLGIQVVKPGSQLQSKQWLLASHCSSRPGWELTYTDVAPDAHANDRPALRALDDATCHPCYKGFLCTATQCPRGDSCPFAHGTHELRPFPPDAPTPQYVFLLSLQPGAGQPLLEFINLEEFATQADAKADLADQCIRALGLSVSPTGDSLDGGACRSDGVWHPDAAEGAAPHNGWRGGRGGGGGGSSGAGGSGGGGSVEAAAKPPLPKWRRQQLLEIVARLAQSRSAQQAAAISYDAWVSTLSGIFGSTQPQLSRVLRGSSSESFREFISTHRAQAI